MRRILIAIVRSPLFLVRAWRQLLCSVLTIVLAAAVVGLVLLAGGLFISNVTADFVSNGMPFPQAKANVHIALLVGVLLVLAWIIPPVVRLSWRLLCASWKRSARGTWGTLRLQLVGGTTLMVTLRDERHEQESIDLLARTKKPDALVTVEHPAGPIRIPAASIIGWQVVRVKRGDAIATTGGKDLLTSAPSHPPRFAAPKDLP
jgi:hypothetical protein